MNLNKTNTEINEKINEKNKEKLNEILEKYAYMQIKELSINKFS